MNKQNFLGMVVHCHHKGGNSKAEMNNANQLEAQRNQMMQQQLNTALATVGPQSPAGLALTNILNNQGMTPQTQAAATSAATALTGANERQAIGSINDALVARGITGGQMAGGGDIARNYGGLESSLAGQQASLLNQIQMQKASNLNQALGIAGGFGNTFAGLSSNFGQQGVGALGAGVQAANNADQAQTGFWGSLTGGLLGLGSSGLTAGINKWG